jgi:acyl carrier protein
MTQSELEERLLAFLSSEIFRERQDITAETDLIAAGFDSMSLVSLLLFVEREYGVWMPENEMTERVLKNARSVAEHLMKSLP